MAVAPASRKSEMSMSLTIYCGENSEEPVRFVCFICISFLSNSVKLIIPVWESEGNSFMLNWC